MGDVLVCHGVLGVGLLCSRWQSDATEFHTLKHTCVTGPRLEERRLGASQKTPSGQWVILGLFSHTFPEENECMCKEDILISMVISKDKENSSHSFQQKHKHYSGPKI